ncbi:hypothetical protein [Bacillus sp. THAF10]|uniref:hypothetical protein n=1 Tax=Bacillus sp. THAF10 TaxID=2587848 RepID=UPI001C12CE09|nr:hypothetical protein [Bacillus sp. THAF10]
MLGLVGCAGEIPDVELAFDYLDDRAFVDAGDGGQLTYSEIDGEYVHDFIKENKDKSVRWTATVVRVDSETTIELGEPLLPSILVTFSEEFEEKVAVGDVLTFRGVLIGYGETFGKDPVWVVRPAQVEETTAEELAELEAYQEKARGVVGGE